MDYITMKEAAKKWSITERLIVYHCSAARIAGAQKMGNTWLIPKDTEKPIDRRTKIKNSLKRICS